MRTKRPCSAIERDAYTIKRVVSEERAVFSAAARLADRQRTVDLRAPDAGPDPRRGGDLSVDVTRAREAVTIAFGKNQVQDFGVLLVRARRDNGKVLARDVLRAVNMRSEREEERRSLRNLAFEQRRTQTIECGQEPKIDRGHGRGGGMGR